MKKHEKNIQIRAEIMIMGSQTVWASSLWTHLLTQGRKDLHISSTTCCGVREKCGTAGKEPKKKESPHEIERDIYIVLSLVLVWLWACVIHDQTTPFLKVLRVASRIPPNAKEMTKTKVLLISEKQWKTKTTMMTLNNTTNQFKFAKKNQSELFHEHDPHAILFYLKS